MILNVKFNQRLTKLTARWLRRELSKRLFCSNCYIALQGWPVFFGSNIFHFRHYHYHCRRNLLPTSAVNDEKQVVASGKGLFWGKWNSIHQMVWRHRIFANIIQTRILSRKNWTKSKSTLSLAAFFNFIFLPYYCHTICFTLSPRMDEKERKRAFWRWENSLSQHFSFRLTYFKAQKISQNNFCSHFLVVNMKSKNKNKTKWCFLGADLMGSRIFRQMQVRLIKLANYDLRTRRISNSFNYKLRTLR